MATNNLNIQPDNAMKIGVRSLIQGRRGPEGQSAYDIYVEVQLAAGLPVLSKEDWLVSLKGENSYDDGPINDTLAALSSRVTAIEDQGPPQGYDDTDIRQSLGALSQEVANIETYDDAAIQARLGQVESGVGTIPAISQDVDAIAGATADLSQQIATLASTVAGLPAPYDDTALEQRVAMVETAPRTTQFVIEDGHLVLIQSDGSKIIGPPTDGVPTPGVAPQLTGGSLTQEGSDLVISLPAVTDGYPTPTLTMTMTRDGVDVIGELTANRIVGAAAGNYEAVWTASNGVNPDATVMHTLTVSAAPVITQQPSITADRSGEGAIVTLDIGEATGDPSPSYEVEWYVGVVPQADTGLTFDTTGRPGDISAQVIWDNGFGTPATGTTNTVTIAAVANRAPVAPFVGAQSLIVGEAYNLDAEFTDPDGDNLTYTFAGTLPQGVTRTGAVFSGTPTTAESVSGTLTADDGTLTADLVINWTVTAGVDGMQTLSNNTVIFTQTGNTVSVIEPAAYAGDYVVPTGTQPVAAVPPLLAGSTREGETMTITRALWWIEPGAGATTISWQIYSNGQPIPGAPQSDSGAMYWDYVLPAGLRGTALTVQERIIQNGVTQTITSAPVTISDIPARKNLDSFTGYGPNTLSGYVGETGLSWTRNPNGTGYGVAIGGGRCYSSVGVKQSPAFYRDSPLSGDQYAGGKLTYGTYTSSYPDTGAFPAVRLSSEPVSGSDGTGYRIGFEHNTQLWMIVKTVGSARTNLGSVPNVDFGFTEAGDTVDVMLEAEGTTLRLYINEVVVLTVNDSTLKTGRIGVMGFGNGSNAIQLVDFYGGEL